MKKITFVLLIALLSFSLLSGCAPHKYQWVVYDVTCSIGWHKLVAKDVAPFPDDNYYIYPSGEVVESFPEGNSFSSAQCAFVKTDIVFNGVFHK